jgi:hypothetical protein
LGTESKRAGSKPDGRLAPTCGRETRRASAPVPGLLTPIYAALDGRPEE